MSPSFSSQLLATKPCPFALLSALPSGVGGGLHDLPTYYEESLAFARVRRSWDRFWSAPQNNSAPQLSIDIGGGQSFFLDPELQGRFEAGHVTGNLLQADPETVGFQPAAADRMARPSPLEQLHVRGHAVGDGFRVQVFQGQGKPLGGDGLAILEPRIAHLPNARRTELRQGFALSHTIFTPEDIEAELPDPTDRPYAGWLYASGTVVGTTRLGPSQMVQDVLQVNLGIVGPSAGGKFVQENWHDLIQAVEPRGWESQLKDEFGFEITAQRLRQYEGPELPFGLETDYALHGGVTLGNVRTFASAGGMARIGWDLSSDFGPPRIRPALAGAGVFKPGQPFGGYLFAGIEGRAVARDMFLDGNLWRDSARVEDRRDFGGDLQFGVALHQGDVQLAFTYVHRTEEFVPFYNADPATARFKAA